MKIVNRKEFINQVNNNNPYDFFMYDELEQSNKTYQIIEHFIKEGKSKFENKASNFINIYNIRNYKEDLLYGKLYTCFKGETTGGFFICLNGDIYQWFQSW